MSELKGEIGPNLADQHNWENGLNVNLGLSKSKKIQSKSPVPKSSSQKEHDLRIVNQVTDTHPASREELRIGVTEQSQNSIDLSLQIAITAKDTRPKTERRPKEDRKKGKGTMKSIAFRKEKKK